MINHHERCMHYRRDWVDPDGSVLQHPDQPVGTGLSIPATMGHADMAALSAAMGSDTAFFEVGSDSDSVVCRCGPT